MLCSLPLLGLLHTTSVGAQTPQPPIFIGQSIATSGSLAEHGRGIVFGVLAHIEEFNRAGGVVGRHIELRTLDDAGDSAKATANSRSLAAMPDVLALFSGAEAGLRGWTAGGHGLKIPQVGCAAGSPICASHSTATAFRSAQHTTTSSSADCQCVAGSARNVFLLLAQPQWRKHLANVRKAARGKRREHWRWHFRLMPKQREELAKKILTRDRRRVQPRQLQHDPRRSSPTTANSGGRRASWRSTRARSRW